MSAADEVIAATVLALFFSVTAVTLRCLARRAQRMRQYTEDYFIYLALLFKVGIDIAGIILLCNGLGRHMENVRLDQLVTFMKTQYSGSFIYPLCIACIKLSTLFQYRRLFFSHSRAFLWQVNILIGVVTLWCVCIIFAAAFICQPIWKLWEPMTEGKCLNLAAFYYGMQIPNIITDLAIILCPVRQIAGLDLSHKMRIGALSMFALGMITLVFDIIRLVALVRLESQGPDITYTEVQAAIWTTVEPAAAIVAACIPSVRSLYRTSRSRSQLDLPEALDQSASHSATRRLTSWFRPSAERSHIATVHSAKSINPNWTSWLKSKTESEAEQPIAQDVAEIETGGRQPGTRQTEAQWAAALRPLSLTAAMVGTRDRVLVSEMEPKSARRSANAAEGGGRPS
ncbi:hypothetical protein LTR85_001979 [Meristemomyces frigidus]|nr:hypothetical protein LTR85_001979 [Meristemomyces frigidus]